MKISKFLSIAMLSLAALAISCEKPEEPVDDNNPVENPEEKPDENPEEKPTATLNVDKAEISLAAVGGEGTFDVTANVDWTATADAEATWLTITPNSGKAAETAVAVKVTAIDNTEAQARTATITVTAGEATKTVTVSQEAAEIHDGTEAHPYLIKTVEDLSGMRAKALPGTETWFRLENDIDMASVTNWIPVNYGDTATEGETSVTTYTRKIHFDGNNKTISNFAPATWLAEDGATATSYPSLFGVLYGSCKNLNVVGAKINEATSACGIIAGYAGTQDGETPMPAVLENVTVKGEISSTAGQAGGLAGVGYNVTATNCNSEITITSSSVDNGGLFGQLRGENTLTGCNTKAVINNTVEKNSRTGALVGWNRATKTTVTNCHVLEGSSVTNETKSSNISGFIAYADNENLNTELTITGCSSKAVITTSGSTNVSGLIACVGYEGSNVKISDSFAEGNITSTQNYCGGIVGRVSAGTVTITNCHYSGTWTGRAGVGGLVGGAEGGNLNISKSYATGSFTCTEHGNQGGICGLLNTNSTTSIENCWSDVTFEVTKGTQYQAGIVGSAQGKHTIKNCFTKGNITGNRGLGGIVGSCGANDSEISGCIAWMAKIESNRDKSKWACGAIVGAMGKTNNATLKNCWRRADMEFIDVAMKLVDHEDVITSRPPCPDYSTENTQQAYHGKAAAAGATISSVAKTIGWDETIWDLSKDVPTLK